MSEWAKVVTDPLGLAGFALFLMFGYLAKAKKSNQQRWLAPLAVCAAIAALAGGLALGYVRVSKSAAPVVNTSKPPMQQTNKVRQSSSGAGSPNVQGVQGDVTITVDQSSAGTNTQKTNPQKTTDKKTDQKK
jgi:hypothetical protein